ncbi:FAD-dependent oxidoreductase [Bradyrhizobium sp. SSUT18]|uniref:FAD-dependent oxidoreductase n=1 Tax=Bradyrhizobium sp. SSUT18 TaxID=3040602 RepID=UPI0024497ACD|nr:FAD-dependent oxidoreductase [Bradyrhizobium sp. SSUT18]MDH2400177.1 FAD-dependent oxidoreductase [Bradyrhizobium sp. SSUT18]
MPIDAERSAHVYEACKLTDNLFVFNPFLPQQNFYSQQLRALALAAEISDRHLAPGHRSVCIVGAGVAGRTIAAAFRSLGANVTIVDKEEVDFTHYRNAIHRELHPNIIFWPFQEPTPATELPFLNWAQAPVTEVVEAMVKEWDESFAKHVAFIHEEVEEIDHTTTPLTIKLADEHKTELKADICVVATGFAAERQFGNLQTPPYWSPSSIIESGDEFMVSGSGDGGLIDALSPILGKDVTKAAHILAARLSKKPMKADVRAVEEERRARVAVGKKDSEDTCPFYSTVHLEDEDAEELEPFIKRKPAPAVTLLHESKSVYSFSAAPINKLLLSHFSNGPERCVTHVKGSLKTVDDHATMVPERGPPECIEPPTTRFAKVMVRHGAPPAAQEILDEADLVRLGKLSFEHLDAALLPGYDSTKYAWTRKGVGKAAISIKVLVDSIEHSLDLISRAYDLDFSNIRVHRNHIEGEPIKLNLPKVDIRRAEGFDLFPLMVGPVLVELGEPDTTRDIDYEN